MSAFYYANVATHVLAAMLWLGGMLFLGAVGAPALRTVEPAELRQRLFHDIGMRFRTLGWWSILVLVVTGTINLHYRGWLHWDGVLAEPDFWATGSGHALAIKLATVTAMILISAVHDFLLGPAAVRAALSGRADAMELRRRAALIARVNALLGVVIVIVAVRLAR